MQFPCRGRWRGFFFACWGDLTRAAAVWTIVGVSVALATPRRVPCVNTTADDPPPPQRPLAELAVLFLKLGAISFGGPAAHIALMEQEVVTRRNWLTQTEFLDMLAATNLIPGPNSTELAIHIGWKRAGWLGLLVAGASFILPAILIVMACAWAYVRYHALPEVAALLYGVKPAIIAIVVQALWRLARTAVHSWWLAVAGALGMFALVMGVDELLVLFGTGAVTAFAAWRKQGAKQVSAILPPWFLGSALTSAAAQAPFRLDVLFYVFLKIGAVLFGSGYVLLAFLQSELVDKRGWLTQEQLLDATAVGQFTPGPVFTTATFVGYLLGGVQGALVATVGIFLPAFLFVALSAPFVPRLRDSAVTAAFLEGVTVASLALMAWVTLLLAQEAISDPLTVVISLVSFLVLLRTRVNSVWILAVAGLVGVAAKMI